MSKTPNLQELFDRAAQNAARMFNESDDHEVLPMWHAVAGNGENILIATPWNDDDEKDAAMDGLRHLFRKHRVKRFAFMTEAWVVEKQPDSRGPRPSDHPDRREVLIIRAEDRDGRSIHGFYYILRPEHGPPTLSPLKVQNFDGEVGRMVGLLT